MKGECNSPEEKAEVPEGLMCELIAKAATIWHSFSMAVHMYLIVGSSFAEGGMRECIFFSPNKTSDYRILPEWTLKKSPELYSSTGFWVILLTRPTRLSKACSIFPQHLLAEFAVALFKNWARQLPDLLTVTMRKVLLPPYSQHLRHLERFFFFLHHNESE